MLRFDRKQQNSVKQPSLNLKKIKNKTKYILKKKKKTKIMHPAPLLHGKYRGERWK